MRHYGAYSNSGHEGTNNAIKYCAGKVTPKHKIDNSLQILVNGSERSMLGKSRDVVMASRKIKTRYSEDVYQSLVTHAAAKLAELVDYSSKLQSVKFNEAQYYVTKKEKGLLVPIKNTPLTIAYALSQFTRIGQPVTVHLVR